LDFAHHESHANALVLRKNEKGRFTQMGVSVGALAHGARPWRRGGSNYRKNQDSKISGQ